MKARWRKCRRCGCDFYDLNGDWTLCHDCHRLPEESIPTGELVMTVIGAITVIVGLVIFFILAGGQ